MALKSTIFKAGLAVGLGGIDADTVADFDQRQADAVERTREQFRIGLRELKVDDIASVTQGRVEQHFFFFEFHSGPRGTGA